MYTAVSGEGSGIPAWDDRQAGWIRFQIATGTGSLSHGEVLASGSSLVAMENGMRCEPIALLPAGPIPGPAGSIESRGGIDPFAGTAGSIRKIIGKK